LAAQARYFLYVGDELGVLARRIDCPTATINSAPSWSVTGKTRKNPRRLRSYPFDVFKGMTLIPFCFCFSEKIKTAGLCLNERRPTGARALMR
ncbi:MAG: hypothetical protein ABSB19_06785, partial [Methylomonas sp.]